VSLSYPLPEPLVELISGRFRVLAEPMRIRILERLRDGESTVQALTEALATSQQNVSKHLAVLGHAGIVGRRKDGNFAYYRVTDTAVFDLCEQVCGALQRDLERKLTAATAGATR
jgi:DNA-binding transcriptional ArsR family regulator